MNQFIQKYGISDACKFRDNQNREEYKSSFIKLHELLQLKGYTIPLDVLSEYLMKMGIRKKFLVFKTKIKQNNPTTFIEYIREYINIKAFDYNKLFEEETYTYEWDADIDTRFYFDENFFKKIYINDGAEIGKNGEIIHYEGDEDQKFFFDLLKEENLISGKPEDIQKIANTITVMNNDLEMKKFEAHLLEEPSKLALDTISLDDLDNMDGYQFESKLGELFEVMGYSVEQTQLSGDQGADLIVEKDGLTTVIQAKNYANKVSNKAVQEITAAIRYYNADQGMVVTTNNFTESAIMLAHSNGIDLINRNKLKTWLNKFPIPKK